MLAAIGWVTVVIWAYLLLGRGAWWFRFPRLPRGTPTNNQSVAAVIPARNEAPYVSAAIRSLLPQVQTVIVVDDDSVDGTGEIAREAGAAVISGLPLKTGWTGKMWAVAQGIDVALSSSAKYLLLTDADIVHAPGAIKGLLAHAERGAFDLASLMVLLRTESFAERALIPAFVFFFLMLYPPGWIEDPRRRTAGAAGGCMMIRREMLAQIGGISTVGGELIDDCALARAVKQSGGKVWLGLAQETRSIREYGGFRDIWRMISRTAFTELNHSAILLTGTILGLLITFVAPPALALSFHKAWTVPGVTAWLLMSLSFAPMLRFYGRSVLWAPLLPMIAVFYAGATIDSACSYWTGRGGAWKGRTQATKTIR